VCLHCVRVVVCVLLVGVRARAMHRYHVTTQLDLCFGVHFGGRVYVLQCKDKVGRECVRSRSDSILHTPHSRP
jgi:hypothetical protein